MQLVAPRTGWAARGGRLYWTNDNGSNWKDITPPHHHGVDGGIFFLGSSTGWVTSGNYESGSMELQINVDSTTDAGATWSTTTTRFVLKDFGLPTDYVVGGGAAAVTFADRLHGWTNVVFSGETMNTWWSFLVLTSDGGRTWKRMDSAPELGRMEMLLISPEEGWLYGYEDSEAGAGLYVTRDGARSWRPVSLPISKKIARTDLGPATCYVMGVPKFENSKHGFLHANCSTYRDGATHYNYALFATNDGGQTWNPDRVVVNLNEYEAQLYGCSAVAGSQWIFAASPGPDLPTFTPRHNILVTDDVIVTKVGAGARIDARVDAADLRAALPVGLTDSRLDLRFYEDITQCSFVTPSDGWVIVGEGYLKSTTNGGKTWKDIVPGPKPHVIQPHQ